MIHHAEFNVGGLLLPWTFVVGILGFVASWVITALLESFRLTRYVWHLSATKQTNKPFRVGTP